MDIANQIIDAYRVFELQHDHARMADIYLAAAQLVSAKDTPDDSRRTLDEFLHRKAYFLCFAIWQAIYRGDIALAASGFSGIEAMAEVMHNLNLCRALIQFQQENYPAAIATLEKYLRDNDEADTAEEALLYLGNAHYRAGNYIEAIESYVQALERRKSFAEAAVNAALAFKKCGDVSAARRILPNAEAARLYAENRLLLSAERSSLAIDENDADAVKNIPIFINSRDRLNFLRRLVDWLIGAGYRQIIILDNDSAYPPLLEYYNNLPPQTKVVYLKENLGYKAIWKSGILEDMNIVTPYVYTDSDVLPIEGCPAEFVCHYLNLLRRYPAVKKAGPDLYCDDKPPAEDIEVPPQKYGAIIEDNLFYTPLDTTFAVYRNSRAYSICESFRTQGIYQCRHLPDYNRGGFDSLPEDERFYVMRADQSSHFAKNLKKNNNR